MVCLISFGKIDKNIFILIISIIIIITNKIIAIKTEFLNIIHFHTYITNLTEIFGRILSFIPFIILNLINKNLKKRNVIINKQLVYKSAYVKKYKNINLKKYLFILLSSFLKYIYQILMAFIYIGNNVDILIFDIVFISAFSYFLLKIKFAKHHLLSIIVITILGIIYNIINLLDYEVSLLKTFILLLIENLFCLALVLNKYTMEFTFCSPFELCFYEGIFSLILYTIFILVMYNIDVTKLRDKMYLKEYEGKYYLDNFNLFFEEFELNDIYAILYKVIYFFIYYLFIFIVIKIYSPFHSLILLLSEGIDLSFGDEETWLYCLNIAIILISMLMILIFTEIIELNFCGLQENTKKNIDIRSRIESMENSEIFDDKNEKNKNIDDSLLIEFDKVNVKLPK